MGPYFIVGNSRSGTTMVGRVLGNHPSVLTFRELHFFEQLWSSDDIGSTSSENDLINLASSLLSIQRNGYLHQGSPERYRIEAHNLITNSNNKLSSADELFSYFLEYETNKNEKKIACDQTPRNVFYIQEILELFPDAKIINMTRDPRDVLLSQKKKWNRRFLGGDIPLREAFRSWVNYHPITISKLWNSSVRSAEKYKNDPRIKFLKFEDLLDAPENQISELCNFLGIEYNKDMLLVPQVGSSTGKDDLNNRGINPKKSGNWQTGDLNDTEIYLCELITNSNLKNFGYKSANRNYNIILLFYYFLALPMQLSFALLLNIKRMKNIAQSITRRMI